MEDSLSYLDNLFIWRVQERFLFTRNGLKIPTHLESKTRHFQIVVKAWVKQLQKFSNAHRLIFTVISGQTHEFIIYAKQRAKVDNGLFLRYVSVLLLTVNFVVTIVRSPVPGACNSHISKCNGIFTDESIFRPFSREIGLFQTTWARTCRHHVHMSTLVLTCNCNWSLRLLWGSEFEINSN